VVDGALGVYHPVPYPPASYQNAKRIGIQADRTVHRRDSRIVFARKPGQNVGRICDSIRLLAARGQSFASELDRLRNVLRRRPSLIRPKCVDVRRRGFRPRVGGIKSNGALEKAPRLANRQILGFGRLRRLRATHLPPLQNDMSRAGGASLGLSQWEGEKERISVRGARHMNATAQRASQLTDDRQPSTAPDGFRCRAIIRDLALYEVACEL
jgi:hypothetical protein